MFLRSSPAIANIRNIQTQPTDSKWLGWWDDYHKLQLWQLACQETAPDCPGQPVVSKSSRSLVVPTAGRASTYVTVKTYGTYWYLWVLHGKFVKLWNYLFAVTWCFINLSIPNLTGCLNCLSPVPFFLGGRNIWRLGRLWHLERRWKRHNITVCWHTWNENNEISNIQIWSHDVGTLRQYATISWFNMFLIVFYSTYI